MKKRTRNAAYSQTLPRLIVLVTCFLAGAVIGSFFAANMSGAALAYVEGYISGTGLALGRFDGAEIAIALDFVLLACAAASAFFRFGAAVPPVVLAAKGFLLSVPVTAFIGAFGMRGYLAAFPVAFLGGFLSVAAMVPVAAQSFNASLEQRGARHARRLPDRTYLLTCAVCAGVTALASLLSVFLTPVMSRAAFNLMM